jgi:hypothetical protein
MFTPEIIQTRLRGRPFVPLRVVLSTGQIYDIHHPDMAMVGHRDMHIGIPSQNNPTLYHDVTRVAIMHIAELRDLPMPASASGNGVG